MGVSNLEARFLSRETRAEEVSEFLCEQVECGGSQLHLPPVGEGNDGPKLARRDAGAFPLHDQSAPGADAHQALEGRGGIPAAFSRYARSAGTRPAAGADP